MKALAQTRMTASHLLALCSLLTACGSDLGPPPGICSALTNVSAYQTLQSTAKVIVDLARFTGRPVSPCRPRSYPQGDSIYHARLATTPRSPPLFTDSIAAPTPICSAEDKSVLIRNEMINPASHATDTSDMENFMERLTGDGPKKDAKPKIWTPGQKRIWIIFTEKDVPTNVCGYGPEMFSTMTRTCTTPAYQTNISPPPPPLSFCCELLYITTLVLISAALFLSTACVFGFAKQFDKLTGVKIPCRELLFVFLTLFPAPGAAATQGLADQSSIQVAVYTNASTSTSMAAVDSVTSWAQLVTACAAPSANITLSPAFKMGAYTNEIDFRLVFTYGCLN
jgi:hypothetical protein